MARKLRVAKRGNPGLTSLPSRLGGRSLLALGLLGIAVLSEPFVWAQSAPFAYTAPAGEIRATSASLSGAAVPNGSASRAWFEWGTRGGYCQSTSPTDLGNGSSVVRVSAPIVGLTNQGIYQCRLVVSNAAGVVYGAAQHFTTGRNVSAWGNNTYGQASIPSGLNSVVALAGGDSHTLALLNDGTVTAWGDDSQGQTNVPANLTNVVAVAGAAWHSLALKADGVVIAWGRNASGQGNVPPNLTNVVAIATGQAHGLGLKADGTVTAWGVNFYGETNVPANLTNVVAIASKGIHCLALKADGTVTAWGANAQGQTNVPVNLTNVVAVACGWSHNLALKADGTVVAWGSNGTGEASVPSSLTNVVAVAAGFYHSLALKADGTVVTWGATTWGIPSTVPADLSEVTVVAGGTSHSLVIGNRPPVANQQTISGPANQDLILALTGTDPNGDGLMAHVMSLPARGILFQYANGLRGPTITSPGTMVTDPMSRVIFVPEPDGLGDPYAALDFAVSDGEFDSPASITIVLGQLLAFTRFATDIRPSSATLNGMAIPNGFPSRAWFEWGVTGNYSQSTTPTELGISGSLVPVSAPISGLTNRGVYQYRLVVSNSTAVVYGAMQRFTTGRKVSAWGSPIIFGQTSVPVDLTNAVAVAAGRTHSVALKADGTVVAWGDNAYGKTNVPVGLSNVVAVAGGGSHSLALKSDGTVVTWGANGGGQTNVPPDLTNVVAIAGGNGHSLAVTSSGKVVAWGANSFGQTKVPPSLSNVVSVAAGYTYSLALKMDGLVVAWGQGSNGETNVLSNLTNIVALAGGDLHCLALKMDETVVAWGANGNGQSTVPADLANVFAVACGDSGSFALTRDGVLIGMGLDVPTNLVNVVAAAGGAYHTLAIGNQSPHANPQSVSCAANRDSMLTLTGSDSDNDLLRYHIVSVPARGTLYQYANGVRGDLISTNGPVSDSQGRMIFAPAPDTFGSAYAGFSFIANDGWDDSAPAVILLNVLPPPPPVITGLAQGTNGTFQVSFRGDSNTTHCIWASTNLVGWQYFGSATRVAPEDYVFLDYHATNSSQRFYRIQAACQPPEL